MTPTECDRVLECMTKQLWPEADWNPRVLDGWDKRLASLGASAEQAMLCAEEYKFSDRKYTKNPNHAELWGRMQDLARDNRRPEPSSREMTAEQWRRHEIGPLATAFEAGVCGRLFDQACWRVWMRHNSVLGEWPQPPRWFAEACDRYERVRSKRPTAAKGA